ncbi:Conserved_hypothetical protein [Hexamita inflata]|uniref:Uncharacterized protein n=1 Tax=Hexamita inflata TaxID=28002 RepID=A0ABP1HGY6_9EUKA
MNVKYLTIRDCNLLSLKELKNITSLEYLDISCNTVFSLKEVEVHKKLITLIIQNTMILDVSQVSELPCLQEFNAENCFIVNTRPLIDHPNFVPKWISLQQEPDSEQIQIYLDSYGNNNQKYEKIKALLTQPPDYLTQMIQRYAPMVQNRLLSIEKDQDITEFSFTDMIQADDVQFNSCPNISFNITPKKLKKLTITNSNLTSIEGVQKIATLEYLNVSNNLLMFIEPIQTLIYLQQVFVDGNMIHDLRIIQNLPNFAWNPVKMQKEATKEDYMIVLKEQYTESRALELKKMFQNNRELDTQFFCMTHFKNLVQGKTLKITNNQEIDNIQFVDYFDIEELYIQNCYNIYFTKYPTKITKLTMNNCKLTTAKIQGLEQMEQLTDLNLGLNALTDDSLETIGYLKNLTNLNLSLNRFNNTSKLGYLTSLKTLDLNQNAIKTLNGVEQLKQLENLDVSYNKLNLINQLENLTNIHTLNISNNQICSIQCISKLVNIVYLNISYNQILSVQICKIFDKLIDLRTHGNKIQDFPTIMSHQNCKPIWQTPQNELSDQDYKNSRQITKLKMGQKYNQNSEKILFKYLGKITNNELVIWNDNEIMNLQIADVFRIKQITIENCENIVFEMAPTYVQILSVRNSKLSHVTNIYQMTQLIDLDLSRNSIRDISELGALVELISLNLSQNDIYRIDELKNLLKLQYLNISNNKILICEPLKDLQITKLFINVNLINDLEFITKMKNFQLIWVSTYSHHHEPLTVIDYQNYLGDNFGTYETAEKMMNDLEDQRAQITQILNNSQIFIRYQSKVVDKKLVIKKEPKLTSIHFADIFCILELKINNCENINFLQVPKQVTNLSVNNCGLTNVTGIEQMKQLRSLNLNDNKLMFIQPVQQLQNLTFFSADFNFISDFDTITLLPNFNKSFFYYQNIPSKQDLENYIHSTNSVLTLQQLIDKIETNENTTLHKRDNLLNEYDIRMIQKYRTEVQQYMVERRKYKLEIRDTYELRDFAFVDKIQVSHQYLFQLCINYCPNVQFYRTPINIKNLYVNNCGLKKINGIEKMKQLQQLYLYNNEIVNIQCLKDLKGLRHLDLRNNKIYDFSVLDGHPYKNQTSDCQGYYLYSQIVPTAQEIEDANK